MAKRQADLSLGDELDISSPVFKKVRVDSGLKNTSRSDGVSLPHLNGEGGPDQRNGDKGITTSGQEEADLHDDEVFGLGDETVNVVPKRQKQPMEGYSDLYLDTINRAVLDFDFEKLCSVSLSNINVYACLVCGKYYQGRGPKSHAYFHALDVGHHVYVNLETKKVYVLPEGYEVKSKSLDDIKYVVNPTFSKEEVSRLDKEVRMAWDLVGKRYRPGKESSSALLLMWTSRLRSWTI
jgi:U4/U6.U5 tri-snRNP-associated protein 2